MNSKNLQNCLYSVTTKFEKEVVIFNNQMFHRTNDGQAQIHVLYRLRASSGSKKKPTTLSSKRLWLSPDQKLL